MVYSGVFYVQHVAAHSSRASIRITALRYMIYYMDRTRFKLHLENPYSDRRVSRY